MESLVFNYIFYWAPIGYAIVFFGMMIEGDTVFFTAIFLARQGFFSFTGILVVGVAGVFTGDFLWYWLGRKLHATSRFYRWAMGAAEPFDRRLRAGPFRILLLSKFTYGLGHLILLRTGALDFKLRQFIKTDIPATIFWIVVVASLRYLAGASFELVAHSLRFAEISLLAGLVVILLIQGIITYFVKRKI